MGILELVPEVEKLAKKYQLALEYLVDSDLVMNVEKGHVRALNVEEWDEHLEREICKIEL